MTSFVWHAIDTSPMDRPILITNGELVVTTILANLNHIHPKHMGSYGCGGHDFEFDFSYADATHWAEIPTLP